VSLRRTLLAALITLVSSTLGGQAHGYVRSTTQGGETKPLYWKESCVPVTIYLNGIVERARLGTSQIVKSIAAAAHAWGPDGVTCADGASHPYLEIVPTLSTSASVASTGYDARNVLVFRTDNWTMGGKVSGKEYSPSALAVTTVIARLDGHIVDADMEINAVSANKAWTNLDPGVVIDFSHDTRDFFDIQNTLTHEFGHFLGLDHSCFNYDPTNPKLRPQDDKGQDVPDCDGPGASAVANTVMFDTSPPLETSKRTLSEDDKRAVCEIYAPSREHEACRLDQPPVGCTVAPAPVVPRPSSRAAWMSLAAASLLVAVVVQSARRRARR
jgi:hypothetical protein